MGLTNQQPFTSLNNGNQMPLLGLGVYDMHAEEAINAVQSALETGYRLIDTAAMYENEQQIGEGIRRSNIPRDEIFLTTKVNNTDQGYDETLKAFEKSMKALNVGYIDMYLIHWPVKNKRKETWKAIEFLYENKMVKNIGVANYLMPFLLELKTYANIIPSVNQMEFSPFLFLQEELNYCKQHQIILQAYTPLVRGQKFNDLRLQKLAEKYQKTPAQIILRWAVQQGISTIPKSSNPSRIRENFCIFDFEIEPTDIQFMNTWNENFRIVDNPLDML
jgi:diketogulonate reductase-like aldo/keto reductase